MLPLRGDSSTSYLHGALLRGKAWSTGYFVPVRRASCLPSNIVLQWERFPLPLIGWRVSPFALELSQEAQDKERVDRGVASSGCRTPHFKSTSTGALQLPWYGAAPGCVPRRERRHGSSTGYLDSIQEPKARPCSLARQARAERKQLAVCRYHASIPRRPARGGRYSDPTSCMSLPASSLSPHDPRQVTCGP